MPSRAEERSTFCDTRQRESLPAGSRAWLNRRARLEGGVGGMDDQASDAENDLVRWLRGCVSA
jgi:hypothetical protein